MLCTKLYEFPLNFHHSETAPRASPRWHFANCCPHPRIISKTIWVPLWDPFWSRIMILACFIKGYAIWGTLAIPVGAGIMVPA